MTEDVTLLNISKDSQVPIFQRSKYILLVTLQSLIIEGKAPQMTVKQLYEWTPLSLDAVASCLYRMSVGYGRPGKPHYRRIYLKRIPTLHGGSLYRILEKGEDFIQRMDRTRPRDIDIWLNELINYRKGKREIQQMMSK